jgi:hypothetical protein
MTSILVSCVGEKLGFPAPARRLYRSDWFVKAAIYAETHRAKHGSEWWILSAKHGLVDPDEVIEPYNETLNEKYKEQREDWAQWVCNVLVTQPQHGHGSGHTAMILAGQR